MPLKQFVKTFPHSASIFENHELDFCCGGNATLEEACRARGLDPDRIIKEITEAGEDLQGKEASLEQAEHLSPAQLVNQIEETHHKFLREQEPVLMHMMEKVVAAHGKKHPELHELERVVRLFWDDIIPHLLKEEKVLFPAIRQMGRSQALQDSTRNFIVSPIKVMQREHDRAGELLARIHELTDGFRPPADACATYTSMLELLREIERDTHMHVHKENNILFPRAMGMEN
jgi:regulator of cell morphogenesis and NO signaling